MQTKQVVYHSVEWKLLVETGWITKVVELYPGPDLLRIALMIKKNA